MSSVKDNMPSRRSGSESSFLLVGNASYRNRGCEAIVRGTVEIMAGALNGDISFTNAYYGDQVSGDSPSIQEADPRISHWRLDAYPRKWTRPWAEAKLNDVFGLNFPSVHASLIKPAKSALCALEIGGDNYTLDYGFPTHLVRMDRWLASRGVPVVIWGASIGPFSENPRQEREMMDHLGSLRAIFVRESATFDYLTKQNGLQNIHLFADPAFAMLTLEPEDEKVRAKVQGAPIAFNISPLLGAYAGPVRKMPWETSPQDLVPRIRECAEIVSALRESTGLPVLLLPHVQSALPGIDDYEFLRAVHRACAEAGVSGVEIADETLGAREIKWLVAKCRMVIAARTHATIAGFSSGVPTISLGYSRKALGINRDVFGTEDYLVMAHDIDPRSIAERARYVLSRESQLRQSMPKRAEELKRSATAAGTRLREILRTL